MRPRSHQTKKTLSENAVEKAVIEWLQERGWRAYRNHVGLFRPIHDSKAVVSIGVKGWPDWSFFRNRDYFHLEVKRPGEKPRPDQLEKLASLSHIGEIAFWTDSLEDFKVRYKRHFV